MNPGELVMYTQESTGQIWRAIVVDVLPDEQRARIWLSAWRKSFLIDVECLTKATASWEMPAEGGGDGMHGGGSSDGGPGQSGPPDCLGRSECESASLPETATLPVAEGEI